MPLLADVTVLRNLSWTPWAQNILDRNSLVTFVVAENDSSLALTTDSQQLLFAICCTFPQIADMFFNPFPHHLGHLFRGIQHKRMPDVFVT